MALGSALELLLGPTTEMAIASCCKNPFFIACHNPIKKWFIVVGIFLICGQLTRYPLIKLFHLSNLLQMPNDHRMINVEFLSNFSRSCKKTSSSDYSQLVTITFWWLATVFLIFNVLVSFAKLLELPLHCTFISSSWAKCIVDVVSCL